jgi:hypothetical protein
MCGGPLRTGCFSILAVAKTTSPSVSTATMTHGILTRFALQCHGEMRNGLVQARPVRHTGAVGWRLTSQGTGGQVRLPDGRYVTVEGPHG